MLINIENGSYDLESLVTFSCNNPKIEGAVAIHSTKNGPAMGGCRVYEQISFDSGIRDAIKLAKAMTYKNTLMKLPYGGGKAVILKHETPLKEVIPYFAKVMNLLNGNYLTTEDVGTNSADMDFLRQYTRYALGEPIKGQFIPSAAWGVYYAIKAAIVCFENRHDLRNLKVGVQGLGKVGFYLCQFLYNEGCELYVCDIKKDLEYAACKEFNAKILRMEEIPTLSLDVFSPCALGDVITDDNYLNFNMKYIIGGANNPLSGDNISDLLYRKGIIYVPDFLSNAGGVLEVDCENHSFEYSKTNVLNRVKHEIYNKTLEILKKSIEHGLPPLQIAKECVHKILGIPVKEHVQNFVVVRP
jgi:leucine dehydrogenase